MRWVGLALLVACGNGAETDDDTDSVVPTWQNPDPTGTPNQEGACADVPEFVVEGMNCDELKGAFEDIVAAASECAEPSDCTAVSPNCNAWDVMACAYPVNKCLDPSIVTEFNSEAAQFGCDTIVGDCECGAAPDVTCLNGKCAFDYSY